MNGIVLPVFDRDSSAVVPELVTGDLCFIAVSAPDTMRTFKDAVRNNLVPAESNFNTVGRCIREIISNDQVVVTATLPGVHRCLPCPQKEPVATMGHIILIDQVVAALLIHKYSSTILPTLVNTMAVSAYIKYDPVMHDTVVTAAVHADANARVK